MQADIEEAKTQEIEKLQSALEELQLQLQETKALLVQEREVARKEVERPPIIQEVPVTDNEMINKLSAENEHLKVCTKSL